MDTKDILKTWYDFANKSLPDEWTITIEEQGASVPRPDRPYISIKILNAAGRVTIDDELRRNGEKFDLVGLRSYTLNIKSYGEGYLDALDNVLTDFGNDDLYNILNKKGIAVTNKGNVLDITAKLETGFEKRGSVDVTFNITKVRETDIGTIEEVQVSGKISGAVKTSETNPEEKECIDRNIVIPNIEKE